MTHFGESFHGVQREEGGSFVTASAIRFTQIFEHPEWGYQSFVGLESRFDARFFTRVQTPETFPAQLVERTPNFFYTAGLVNFLNPEMNRAVSYIGVATLREVRSVDPIPEPTTIALVGTGIALVVRRQKQRFSTRRLYS